MAEEPGPAAVMVVDDTPQNLALLEQMLREEGHRAFCFPRGDMALRAAEREAPDLILLDINMPVMSGFEVCEHLKSNPELAQIPVIFLSAHDELESRLKGLQLGAVDYIAKPIQIAEVRARVNTHLQLHFQRMELERQNALLRRAEAFRDEVEAITQHDLKAPITTIIGFTRLLLGTSDNLTASQRQQLERVDTAARRMMGLVNSSLDTFKMEQALYQYRPAPMDLLSAIEGVLEDHRALAATLNVELSFRIDGEASSQAGETFEVDGEAPLIQCLLGNLTKNAIESAPAGSCVDVDLERGETCRLAVHNLGEVPEDMRGRFFEKYATSGKHGGTGIGTYAARLTADTMGGQIELDTTVAGETTVTVLFPRRSSTEEQPHTAKVS